MVRMSQMMTLACATILVAGTAANAADKVTVAPSKGLVSAQPTGQSLRARLPGLNYTPSANGNQSSVSPLVSAQNPLNVEPGSARAQPSSTKVSSAKA